MTAVILSVTEVMLTMTGVMFGLTAVMQPMTSVILAGIAVRWSRDDHASGKNPAARRSGRSHPLLRQPRRQPAVLSRLQLAMEGTAELAERTSFGQKYVVRGRIAGHAGRTANVVSVWIILNNEESPRFVTVYPGAHS